MKKHVTRRNFLKMTGAATATSGLALAGLANAKEGSALPANWDETFDVIVIGSGFAGLSAAIEAKNAGASVVVLEKMPVPGGNSIINGGGMAVVGSDIQSAHGVKDSVETMLADMYQAGLGLNYPEQARMVAERSNDAFEWCRDYLGVKFKDTLAHFGGHSVPRTHTTTIQSGAGFVQPMLAKCEALGVPMQKKIYVKRLIMDDTDRVVGLEVIRNYRQGKEDSKKVRFLKANKAVVVASGGFAADVAYRSTQDPRLTEELATTNHKGATSECLKELIRLGANPVQLSWIQLGPWASPDEKGFGLAPIFAAYAAYPHGLMVDPRTGKRFVNELADRKVRADAIIKTGHPAICLCDAAGTKPAAHVMGKLLERQVVRKFDSLQELAAFYQIPGDELLAQVGRYNRFVTEGKDTEFDKPLSMGQQPISDGPFYAARFWPKAHHTMGGVEIDTEARVLDISTHQPIAGLFAAGEITGGTHGACRLGTVAIPDCIVFGRIAGRNAANA
ncbi:flavocytochrome c [Ferrimonas sediminicola]|uniref:Flavocytochrome c n=1 Tax=Ferrimonas sediminicola TaxID=2569538 RepID=A0A4U1B6N0_9GAMM|nr:flavocytochrome c [Ferrimonas sediminicola]TKB46203.1 flavocytochrome c [Ferrimonas sediminicola]